MKLTVLFCNEKYLPALVAKDANNRTKYMNDASGRKLRTQVYENGLLKTTTDYCGAFVYENKQLQYIQTAEGRIAYFYTGAAQITKIAVQPTVTSRFEYFLTDHLGNTRVVFTKGMDGTAQTVQEDHYYPFGLQLSGQGYTNTSLLNKYLFNGKEKQDQTGMYDYGFRQLDPVLGRWFCVDRMAEKYLSTSPYVYAGNDPINNVDVMGLSWGSHFKGWIKEETHQFGNYIKEEGDQFGDYQRKHNFEDVAVSLTNPFTFVSYLSSTVDAIHNKDWSRLDPTFRGTIINNSSLIQGGLWRSVFSLKLSTMVYGSVGYGISQFYNNIGQVKNVGYFHGATVVQQRKFGFDYAMTLGNFIMGKTVATSIRNSPDGLSLEESVLLHEYGHYQQSLHFDIIDYTRLCINSVAHNSELDKKAWSERDASLRGLELARDLEITTTGYGERTWPEKLYRTEWTGDWDAVSKSLIFYMNWAGHR